MKISALTIGMALGLGMCGIAVTASPARAASPVCQLKEGLQRFAEARDGASIRLELDARKGLLYVIAACTKEETEETIAMLKGLEVPDAGLAEAKNRLIGRLEEEFLFTDAQKLRVGDVGVQGTRDIARGIKEWRMNVHLPQAANANNFSLWEKNQNLIGVAETRSRQINQTLRNLKLDGREEIKMYANEAGKLLADARESNQNAKEALRRLENPETAARSLRNSFNSLSAVYDSFLKVSGEVKKVLPL